MKDIYKKDVMTTDIIFVLFQVPCIQIVPRAYGIDGNISFKRCDEH